MNTATNGNTASAIDPRFIHFTDEQTGLLLPNIPGYPSWLPNLQITPTGRLCFWNFPNIFPQSVVSNPANIGTVNYLMNGKIITASNNNPPVPGDLGVNGSTNEYFWDSCVVRVKVDNNLFGVWNNLTKGYTLDQIVYLKPGEFIMMNIQFYINRYLNTPYKLFAPGAYKYPWPFKMLDMFYAGQGQKFLNGCNFLINLDSGTDFVDQVDKYAPVVGAAILTFASGLAGTPALVAILGALGSAATTQQAKDAAAALAATIVNPNTAQIKSDVQTLTAPPVTTVSNEKKFLFVALAVLLLLIIVLFFKSKK